MIGVESIQIGVIGAKVGENDTWKTSGVWIGGQSGYNGQITLFGEGDWISVEEITYISDTIYTGDWDAIKTKSVEIGEVEGAEYRINPFTHSIGIYDIWDSSEEISFQVANVATEGITEVWDPTLALATDKDVFKCVKIMLRIRETRRYTKFLEEIKDVEDAEGDFLPDYTAMRIIAQWTGQARRDVGEVMIGLSNILRKADEYSVGEINLVSLRLKRVGGKWIVDRY